MKCVYAFLATLLLVGASAFPYDFNHNENEESNDLDKDLQDFYSLLDQKELQRVIENHIQDPEFWKNMQYLLSDDFHKLVYAAEDLTEFHKYVLYLQAAGYDAIWELRETHKVLGMKEYQPSKPMTQEVTTSLKNGGGLDSYIDDLISIVPKEKIRALHIKKVKESPAFAKFHAALVSPQFAQIRTALYAQKDMQTLVQQAKANGFDFQKYYGFRYQLLGFPV